MSLKNRKSSQDSFSPDGPGPVVVKRSSSLLSFKKPVKRSNSQETSELEPLQLHHSLGSKMMPSSKKTINQSVETSELEASQPNYSITSKMIPREQNIAEDNLERPNEFNNSCTFLKYNKTFHKLFPDIPEGDRLTHVFTCSLQREVLYHGKLFVSEYHLCFYSSVLLKETRVVIPVSSVRVIKKHNSALSILSITTASGEKHSFVSLRDLKFRYKLLQRICSQSQEESGNSSPQLSPAETDAVRGRISSSSSLEGSMEQDPSSVDLDNNFLQMVGEGFTDVLLLQRLLLLLMASGYIGLRIIALEEQLSSLGALADLSKEYQET
ncbi:GRAM domain-containing protein 2B-like [Nematolebias whitei]|uniref:GRAM domain-containing protein 2B-like n=1 Tax=Nematolebias whitei TaxID=451745 RepID=UPI00189BA941|nr:GRAM domain-containing protein 2B-like [Nematolebias whitei]